MKMSSSCAQCRRDLFAPPWYGCRACDEQKGASSDFCSPACVGAHREAKHQASRLADRPPPTPGDIICAVPWPICPICIASQLVSSGGIDTCRSCGRKWATVREMICGQAATHQIIDTGGGSSCVCGSHAELARRQIAGVVVEPLPAR